jgi:hypothetical protein
MTGLTILKALKANRGLISLNVHHATRTAVLHIGGACDIPVDYAEAILARTDPALDIVSVCPVAGETLVG